VSWRAEVRVMFVIYLVLIVVGLVLFALLGLAHQ
jgi:hypothetical protein